MAHTTDPVQQFERTWASPTTFPGLLAEVNNLPLGKRFMTTAFVFFLMGGLLALLMRLQLVVSENNVLGPQVYNELFTMHGSTMMFLFAVPFLEGLALYLLPMMVGARDMAFPRLSAFGYWVYLFGGIVFYASYLFGAVPDVGWFGYTPLSTSRFTGVSTDFWLLGLSLVEVAGLTAAIEIVVTILKFRAPGMTLARMPLFAWAMLVTGIMILVAFSVLLTATMLLELDRTLETRFFDVNGGGNDLLWQHLFWFFGHPEVYIMFLPATGIISMIVTTSAGRPMVGYTLVVVSIVVTGFVSFGLWAHHMFTAGLPSLAMSFFTASSLMIAIASGVQVFAWIGTLWGSGPRFHPPLLFVLGFLFLFVMGGMTGVMVAVVPFNLQVHDSYFIVAHFHYVIIGGVLFPLFAGLHYWLPKLTGRLLSSALGKWAFWLMFVGFNATFFPMHIMGLLGLPRRVYTYSSELQLDAYNILATAGSFTLGAGTVVFLVNFAWSLWRGEHAGDNPWNADSLEWSLPSPPPVYTYFELPVVHGRNPLWSSTPLAASEPDITRIQAALAGQPAEWRATLATDSLQARPQAIQYLPGNTYVPFWAAVGATLCAVGVLGRAYSLSAISALFLILVVAVWLLPRRRILAMLRQSDLDHVSGLTLFPTGSRSTSWWGMIGWLTILSSALGALVYSYAYIRMFSQEWPQDGIALPALPLPTVAYGLIVVSGGIQAWALRVFRQGAIRHSQFASGATISLAVAFLGWQLFAFQQLEFRPHTNAYASLFYVLSSAMILVTSLGVALNAAAQFRMAREDRRNITSATLQMEITSLHWVFTSAAAAVVFSTLYLSPHLLPK